VAETPNISLQRTAPCGLAAELGSCGGCGRVASGALWILLTAAVALGGEITEQGTPRESRIAAVSLSPGMCVGDCLSWSIELMNDGSAIVSILHFGPTPWRPGTPRDDAGGMLSDQHHIAAGNAMVRDLIASVEDLDPSIPRLSFTMDAPSFRVSCEPPGSLYVDHSLDSDRVGSQLYKVRDLAGWIIGYIQNDSGATIP